MYVRVCVYVCVYVCVCVCVDLWIDSGIFLSLIFSKFSLFFFFQGKQDVLVVQFFFLDFLFLCKSIWFFFAAFSFNNQRYLSYSKTDNLSRVLNSRNTGVPKVGGANAPVD